MEEVAEAFKVRFSSHPSPLKDPVLIDSLKAFVNCLIHFSQDKGQHILSPLAFRESLQPYLTSLIQMAKKSFYKHESETPPFHTPSQHLFIHQHGLEKPFDFHSQHYRCHIFVHDLTNIHATFIFDNKGATLSMGFSAFDDLLEMAHYVSRFVSSKDHTQDIVSLPLASRNLSFLWSLGVHNTISSLLQAKGSSFMLDGKETQEFVDFLLEISDKFSTPLKALRYQLGSL